MKSIYILSDESRIVKATRSLDEMTIWKAQGGLTVEVPLSLGENLASYIDNGEVYIQNEDGERLATAKVEIYNDPIEHLLHDCTASHYEDCYKVGRVIFDGVLLENLNLTKDLTDEIMSNCEELASNELNELKQ